MLPTLRLLVTVVAFHALAEIDLRAQDFFVTQHGDDASGDGSRTRPWRTLTHALRVMPRAKAGSRNTLHVGVGTWYATAPENFPLTLPHDVHFRGADRNRTIIAGRRVASRQPLVAPTATLLRVTPLSPGQIAPMISNCTLIQARYGVQLDGGQRGGAIAHVQDCTFTTSIYAVQSTNGVLRVSRCRFVRNTGGIQLANVVTGDPPSLIEDCHFESNGVGMSLTNTLGATIQRNRFDFNSTGLLAGAIGGVRSKPRFENNVYYRNGHGLLASAAIGATLEPTIRHETFCENSVGLASLDGTQFGGVCRPDIANSIIWGSKVTDLSGVTEDEIRHSSFRTALGAGLAPILGRRGMVAIPPRFEDAARGDLRIRNDSGLINRGATLPDAPTTDAEGEPRGTDHPDFGADEVNRFLIHVRAGSRPGEVRLFLDAPNDRGRPFFVAASAHAAPKGGIRIGSRRIPLLPDPLFGATAGHPSMSGRLNGAGQALLRFTPTLRERRNAGTIHFVFVTVEPSTFSAGPIRTISNVVSIDFSRL